MIMGEFLVDKEDIGYMVYMISKYLISLLSCSDFVIAILATIMYHSLIFLNENWLKKVNDNLLVSSGFYF